MVTADTVNAFVRAEWGERVECLEIDADRAVVRLQTDARDLRPGGYVCGPAQFEVADTALYLLAFGALGRLEPMALTSELSIRFLRPAVGERLIARATLERAGRRMLVATVRVWVEGQAERPCAVAQGTCTLPTSEA